MANTFIQLNDTPGSYNLAANKFARVNNTEDGIQFWFVDLSDLESVVLDGAYAPSTGQTLVYNSDGKWKPGSVDVYGAGNGISKVGLNLNVQAGIGGGLTSNSQGVYISDVANVSGTHGNSTYHPVITVNSKGQITGVTAVESAVTLAEDLNADFVGNVVGTSGQISVLGGTGKNSNATLNLVATGVTAGVYGNTTHIPQITVDTYGRIQNIDLVNVTGNISGSSESNAAQYASLAYKTIAVEGAGTQTPLSADQFDDTLTFVAGGGISLTTNAAQDKLTFTTDGSQIISTAKLSDISDVNTANIMNGEVLLWDAANAVWNTGMVDARLANTGVVAGTYGDTGNVAQFTVDDQGRITSVTEIAIPQGDITGVVAGTGLNGGGSAGTVTLNLEQTGVSPGTYGDGEAIPRVTVDALGRVLSISNVATASSGVTAGTYGTGTIIPQFTVDEKGRITNVSNVSVASGAAAISDLTDVASISGISNGQALVWNAANSRFEYGSVASSYGDSDVLTLLNGSVSNSIIPDANVAYDLGSANYRWRDLYLSGNTITLGGSTISSNDSSIVLGSTVIPSNFSGNIALQSDVVSANTSMKAYVDAEITALIGGANISLDTLGEVANALANSNTELSAVAFTGNYNDLQNKPSLALTGDTYLTLDGANIDLTNVVGQAGATGAQGVGVSSASLNGAGNLILTLSDASTVDAGNVKGETGAIGATGPKGDTGDTGAIGATGPKGDTGDTGATGATGPAGADGAPGADGVGITGASLVGGNLVLNYSNTSTQDLGNIQGPQGAGAVDQTLSLAGNVITISGSGSTVDLTSAIATASGGGGGAADTGNITFTGDTISSSGDGILMSAGYVNMVATGSGPIALALGSNSWLFNADGTLEVPGDIVDGNGNSVLGDPDQTLSLVGSTLTISGSNSSVDLSSLGGGGSGSQNVFSNIVVSGQDTIAADSTTDTLTFAAGSGIAITTNSTTDTVTISATGSGGGSGATVERFKLNYATNGNLDSITDNTSGIAGVSIDSATSGEVSITFTGYNYPPASVMLYGYDYANNKYYISHVETTMATREIAGGGSSGSPTLFSGSATPVVKLRLRETETGASRSFGTTTHAWVHIVMFD